MKQDESLKEMEADTLSGVLVTTIGGSVLDFSTGLNFIGILASRASAAGINLATSAPYGMWRNYLYYHTNHIEKF